MESILHCQAWLMNGDRTFSQKSCPRFSLKTDSKAPHPRGKRGAWALQQFLLSTRSGRQEDGLDIADEQQRPAQPCDQRDDLRRWVFLGQIAASDQPDRRRTPAAQAR